MKYLILSSVLLWMLVSCATIAQGTPATVESLPSAVPTNTAFPDDPLDSQETPMQEWQGIPIMPEATEAQTAGPANTYSFRVNTTPKEVQTFYVQRLGELGWSQPFDDPFDENGGTLTFRNEGSSLSISVMLEEGSVLVVLAMALA